MRLVKMMMAGADGARSQHTGYITVQKLFFFLKSPSQRATPTTMSDSASTMVDAHDEFGPMLIGLVVAAIFGGITVVQALTFLQTNKRDPIQHTLAVYSLLFLDVLHICFFTHSVYYYLVSNADNLRVQVVWSMPAFVLIHSILIPIAQLLSVARIWKIVPRNKLYIPIFLVIVVLSNLSLGIHLSRLLFQTKDFNDAIKILYTSITKAYFSLRICSDILIASAMIFYLTRASTNLNWTDSSSTMLIAYVLNTGAIPSFLSIAVFGAVLAEPNTLLFLTIEEVGTKLYVTSFMAMLNARYYLQPHGPKAPPAFFLRSGMTSHAGTVGKLQASTSPKTINEVGLPLFQSNSRKEEMDSELRVEVVVKQDTRRTTN
ncbi:hypothetical protein BDZ94DRAFT_1299408 [Collybia nuda]|uniref:DUF6534 domain-containing protein n=1 Tax=Collybia nuda TaxID=64659 RepID=A0A9P5Y0P0_9AGAR|nr:hypothetical protein BDZ94DRAFT_1299408 [Collybia nuda]